MFYEHTCCINVSQVVIHETGSHQFTTEFIWNRGEGSGLTREHIRQKNIDLRGKMMKQLGFGPPDSLFVRG